MAIRLVITDAVWADLGPALRIIQHSAGSPPQLHDRMFIEAVLYQARTGIPWRDLPDDFGHWAAVYNRFRRWEGRNIGKHLWHTCNNTAVHWPTRSSSIRRSCGPINRPRAHEKNRWPRSPGSWPSRGGFATKLHAACSDEHTGGCLILTSGARHDAPGFALVWHDLPTLPGLDAAVMDKAYDSDAIRQVLQNQGVEAVIPSQTNRSAELPYAKAQYKCRQIVERFFNKLKHFRRIATRYDKLSRTLLAFIHLVATWMIIR
jgi:transposase